MKRLLTTSLVGLAAALFAAAAFAADTPPVTPFPSAHSGDVFVIAETTTDTGAVAAYYKPGATVYFRAYAVDGKTRKFLTPTARIRGKTVKVVRDFYVKLPNGNGTFSQLKFKYTPKSRLASGNYRWTAAWNVPATYPVGVVSFKVVARTYSRHLGSFVQVPVATSMLTISNTAPDPGTGPTVAAPPSGKVTIGLYADAVNSPRPPAAAPRPIGCTQTNVFKRGERVVIRAWGFDLLTGNVLSMDNVVNAHFTVPGQSDVTLNWGAHGAVGNKVWFWAAGWSVPTNYPLGDVLVKVSFTLDTGKVGTFDYPITILP
jgi:hypothetical protein